MYFVDYYDHVFRIFLQTRMLNDNIWLAVRGGHRKLASDIIKHWKKEDQYFAQQSFNALHENVSCSPIGALFRDVSLVNDIFRFWRLTMKIWEHSVQLQLERSLMIMPRYSYRFHSLTK